MPCSFVPNLCLGVRTEKTLRVRVSMVSAALAGSAPLYRKYQCVVYVISCNINCNMDN